MFFHIGAWLWGRCSAGGRGAGLFFTCFVAQYTNVNALDCKVLGF